MKRLRQLEDENAKLKRIVAELSLDKAMLQDVLKKSFKACSETSACESIAIRLESISQTGLFHTSSCSIALYLQVPTERSGRSEGQDQRYL
jgi:uncharacterized protein YllA (UPF0747 family)